MLRAPKGTFRNRFNPEQEQLQHSLSLLFGMVCGRGLPATLLLCPPVIETKGRGLNLNLGLNFVTRQA